MSYCSDHSNHWNNKAVTLDASALYQVVNPNIQAGKRNNPMFLGRSDSTYGIRSKQTLMNVDSEGEAKHSRCTNDALGMNSF